MTADEPQPLEFVVEHDDPRQRADRLVVLRERNDVRLAAAHANRVADLAHRPLGAGLVLAGFVLGHMTGNLLMFKSPAAINAYAKWLHENVAHFA